MSKKPLLNESTVRQFMKFANLGGLADKFVNEAYMQEDDMEEGRHKEGRMREEEMEEGRHDKMGEGRHEDMEEGMMGKIAGGALGAMAGGGIPGAMMGSKLGSAAQDKLGLEEDEMEEGHEEGHMGEDAHMEEAAHEMEEGAHDPDAEIEEAAHEDNEDADPVTDMDAELTDRLEQAAQKAAQALLDALGVEGEVSLDGADADMGDMDDMGDMGDMDKPMDAMDDDEGEVLDEVDLLDEEEIVNETMTRVMKRLQAMNESKKAESKRNEIVDSVADAIIARLRAKK